MVVTSAGGSGCLVATSRIVIGKAPRKTRHNSQISSTMFVVDVPPAGHTNGHMNGHTFAVVMVNDHRMLTQAMVLAVAAVGAFTVIDAQGSVGTALRLVADHRPAVVLLDLRVGDVDDTVSVIPSIRSASPATRVVILSTSSDDWSVARAVDAGCHGYLVTSQSLEELCDGVRTVARGGVAFAPAVLGQVLGRTRAATAHSEALTPREIEVLRKLADGKSTSEIATALFVSPNTVRNHVNNVIRKLHAHSRLEAVSHAVRLGLIRLQ
ncbi:MAG: hypothetical protein RI958_1385 [Actinomycetota bacterium]